MSTQTEYSDWDYPAPFITELTAGDQDIDSLGHVNNIVYAQWCQDVAWQHSTALGLCPDSYQRLGRAMAIISANYQYLAATFVGERLDLATWLTDSDGRLSMQRSFQLRDRKTGKTAFRAQWQLACIRLDSGKPCRMPKEFLEVYEPAVQRQAP